MLSVVVYGIFIFLFVGLLLVLSYQEQRGETEFEMWESKAFLLAAPIALTTISAIFSEFVLGEAATASDFYRSAPVIFEILVPISALLILQHTIPERLDTSVEPLSAVDPQLPGFALACLLSILIVVIPRQINILGPVAPESESMLLYFAISLYWIYDRGRVNGSEQQTQG